MRQQQPTRRRNSPSRRFSASPAERPAQRGFTLIELVVTVAIIAILATIATPVYTGYIRASHRSAAVTTLLNVASREERYYSTNNVYTVSLTGLGYPGTVVSAPDSGQAYYQVSLASVSTTSYKLQAVPVGGQAQDECGTFTLDSLGQKAVTGTASVASCWH